jgi:hypothetical protein
MAYSIFALAAAAAAAHGQVSPEQARAAGYAQAQQALAGTDGSVIEPPVSSAVAPATIPGPAQATAEANGVQGALMLTCGGGGMADKQRGSFIGGGWGWATMVSHHDRQFNDQVDVRLFGGDDRIRLPRTMLPGFHGGADGWFKLKDVVADARSIRASAAVAAFHNPKVYIDRMTGTISISGKSGDFSGQCGASDRNAAAKF